MPLRVVPIPLPLVQVTLSSSSPTGRPTLNSRPIVKVARWGKYYDKIASSGQFMQSLMYIFPFYRVAQKKLPSRNRNTMEFLLYQGSFFWATL